MKKRVMSILLLACMMCLLLAGCQKSGGDAAYEARGGVVRLLTVDRYGNMYVGSAFGVGAAGKETIYFVTNHHVVTDN